MKYYCNCLLFLLVSSFSFGQTLTNFFNDTDDFLNSYVENGRVDYASVKKNPNTLIATLEIAKKIKADGYKANEYQAFWVNVYNLLVIDGIVKHYPIQSPLDIPGFFDKNKHQVGGENITLNAIENKLLRAKYPNEPRFHFVLVCAGIGCPPIIKEAYRPAVFEIQLKEQTVKALNNPKFIRVNGSDVQISQIFDWYKQDFEQKGSGIKDFINNYRNQKLPENSTISFYPYDWKLNESVK
ncbi:DUF547 domain-containing protein [Maribacter sp. CXY002]|uniref:DUF547 domain-containing protein n=1 Tax=Maribacter luteocoastalis TaxID=3407671 RepID=UPI003B66EC18